MRVVGMSASVAVTSQAAGRAPPASHACLARVLSGANSGNSADTMWTKPGTCHLLRDVPAARSGGERARVGDLGLRAGRPRAASRARAPPSAGPGWGRPAPVSSPRQR